MNEKQENKTNHWIKMWEGIKSFSIVMEIIFFTIGKWMFEFTMFIGEMFNNYFKNMDKKPRKKKIHTKKKKNL